MVSGLKLVDVHHSWPCVVLTQCRPVLQHQVDVVPEQAHEADCEHARHEEQEHDVKPTHAPVQLAPPELQKVADGGEGHVDAVEQCVAQEQYKELVVVEVDAVVDPRTVQMGH